MMHERGKSDSAVGATKPANKAERSAAELVEQRAGTKGNADQQSTRRAQDRESVSQALGRIRQASPSSTRGKSRMHKGARTDLCGGRGVTRVPTATRKRTRLTCRLLDSIFCGSFRHAALSEMVR
jgi:hypothetical protein